MKSNHCDLCDLEAAARAKLIKRNEVNRQNLPSSPYDSAAATAMAGPQMARQMRVRGPDGPAETYTSRKGTRTGTWIETRLPDKD